MKYLGTIADGAQLSEKRLKERIVECFGKDQRVFTYEYFFYDRFFYHIYNVDKSKESYSQILDI